MIWGRKRCVWSQEEEIQSCCLFWQITPYNAPGAMIFGRWRITSCITSSWDCPVSDRTYRHGIREPQGVILCICFINHFPLTEISAPSSEQTSFTSASSWHRNLTPPAAGRHSYQHIYLNVQQMDFCCQSHLVPLSMKNKTQILKTLSSPKWKKKKNGTSSVIMKQFCM